MRDYYLRALAIVRADPGDIYHAHDLNTLPLAVMAHDKTGGKVVYDSHELFTETSTLSRLERFGFKVIESRLIHRADVVITVNNSIADELVARYKLAQRPHVIMNCPPSLKDDTALGGDNHILHEELGLPLSIPIVLYQGGFAPHRGLENLILSVKHYKKGVLVLLGWGKIEEDLRSLAKREGLDDKIFFLEPVPQEELLLWTSSAQLGVIPYQYVNLNNYYTTPNKLFEYIQSGIPVAGSHFPELKKIIDGYGIGKTFDPESPIDIANAVNDILADRVEYARMRENTKSAARVFNWENEGRKLVEIYNELSGRGAE